ncbi:MAG: pilin [Candidatus Saccharibacteria bacterium]|nr:pilin [Candidatus Saccharibacteria bacterium]
MIGRVLDFAGTFKVYLVVVLALVFVLLFLAPSATADHGLTKAECSARASNFTSEEFRECNEHAESDPGGLGTAGGRYGQGSPEHCTRESSTFLNFPTWYKYLDPTFTDGECKLDLDFEETSTYTAIFFAILEIILRIAGLVAVIFVIVGGFTFITSDGQPEKAKNARWTILNALIGLAIALSATVLVNFIGNNLGI